MSKLTNHTTLIICEGENTEPYFFESVVDFAKERGLLDTKVWIFPEPKEDKESDTNFKTNKHKPKRKKRTTRKIAGFNLEIESAGVPLNWVKTGIRELNEGTYNEVWVVFDHDNHPKRKEAFEAAKETEVKLIFSSRSFEYYFLVHFERIYRHFTKTDCKFNATKDKPQEKRKTVFVRCGTNKYSELDCKGSQCINGYAQVEGYWSNTEEENSKKKGVSFQKIESHFEKGFENSAWVRYKSELVQANQPVYERNPYVNADLLIKRLIKNEEEYKWISRGKEIKGLKIHTYFHFIFITNISTRAVIFQENSITAVFDNERETFGERKIIEVERVVSFEITKYSKRNVDCFKVKHQNINIMIEAAK